MRKKFIARSLFLTPLYALLISYSTYFVFAYPKSHIALLSHIDSSISLGESFFQHEDSVSAKDIEARVLARLSQDQKSFVAEAAMTRQTAMQVLDMTVRVHSGPSRGSGVLIYEEKIDDVVYTYIITNHHVIHDKDNIFIEKFVYLKEQTISSTEKYPAKLVADDEALDLAIIQVTTPESVGTIAKFQTLELETNMKLYQRVYLSGCPLGDPPLITSGHIGFLSTSFTRVTAFSIFGNSGGGAFDKEGNLIGVVKGVAIVELDKAHRIPEPNLTHVISGPVVRSWIFLSDLSFIISEQPGKTHKAFLIRQKELSLQEEK